MDTTRLDTTRRRAATGARTRGEMGRGSGMVGDTVGGTVGDTVDDTDYRRSRGHGARRFSNTRADTRAHDEIASTYGDHADFTDYDSADLGDQGDFGGGRYDERRYAHWRASDWGTSDWAATHDDDRYPGGPADDYAGDDPDATEDFDDFPDEVVSYTEPIDRRWIWVAAAAGVILVVAVLCTVVILGGGDSGSVSRTVVAPAPTSTAPTSSPATPSFDSRPAPAPVPPAPLPGAALSPETVTTVAPEPPVAAAAPPAPLAVPADAARTITYTVTGSRQLLDLVTVIYTDERGALRTDLNVALPWTRTVVLDPGVTLTSVTATSLAGQLDCAIADGAGTPIAVQNTHAMIATCTR